MDTFIANLKHAIRNRETVTIGGGEFTPQELQEVVKKLEELRNAVKPVDEPETSPYNLSIN